MNQPIPLVVASTGDEAPDGAIPVVLYGATDINAVLADLEARVAALEAAPE